jgi:DNA-binding beta-propeller fold protein YncE
VASAVNVLRSYTSVTVPAGSYKSELAVNPRTNIICVTDPEHGSVYAINGKTNRLMAGIAFHIIPSNLGTVSCNGQKL